MTAIWNESQTVAVVIEDWEENKQCYYNYNFFKLFLYNGIILTFASPSTYLIMCTVFEGQFKNKIMHLFYFSCIFKLKLKLKIFILLNIAAFYFYLILFIVKIAVFLNII